MNKKEKLKELELSERIFKHKLKSYEPNEILKDLQEIDEKINELLVEKNKIIDERQNLPSIRLAELKYAIKENLVKQEVLKGSNNLLKRLTKVVKTIKRQKNL